MADKSYKSLYSMLLFQLLVGNLVEMVDKSPQQHLLVIHFHQGSSSELLIFGLDCVLSAGLLEEPQVVEIIVVIDDLLQIEDHILFAIWRRHRFDPDCSIEPHQFCIDRIVRLQTSFRVEVLRTLDVLVSLLYWRISMLFIASFGGNNTIQKDYFGSFLIAQRPPVHFFEGQLSYPKTKTQPNKILLYYRFTSTMEVVDNKCWTPGCGKKAAMVCPTCKQMDLDPSHFCSQECFKKTWPIHKLVHIPREEQQKKRNEGFKFSGPLRPGIISKKRPIPEHIVKPDYYYTSVPKKEQQSKFQKDIEVKSEEQIAKLREVAVLARKTLDKGHSVIKAGVTTDYIDEVVHNFIIENGAYPSPYNYYKFPKSLCTSVNEVICHGIPDDRPLQNGDIVNLDVTIYKNGVHVDLNETYLVGEVAESSKFLVTKAYECLQKAIDICKPGTMYRQVGNVITKFIEENGLSVNRTYCGHGVGSLFHCAPNVPHYAGNKATGFMKPGHVFTIEPMINAGVHKDITWPDNWTAVTADGQRSAQFEHTLLITEGGVEVLTKRLEDSPPLQFML